MSNDRIIWDRLTAAGMTPAGAAGLLGNLQAESGLRPDNLQNTCEAKLGFTDAGYTVAVDNGTYTNFVHDGAGYGIAQWTYTTRKAALLAFAQAQGASIGDLDMQVSYLVRELQARFERLWGKLCATASVREASDAVLLDFERPACVNDPDKLQATKDRRGKLAQEFYNRFAKGESCMKPQERLIATAESQVGYFGKKTNANLGDFTAGTPGLYNKFARDLDALGDFYNGRKNGYDWCDVFVDWCFVHTFGREAAQKLLCQTDRSCGAGTGYSLGYYKARGRLFTSPEPGDQIFFGDAKSTWHTGIVTAVGGGYVYTIEGNAGNPSAVRECRYAVGSKTIKGYGRPDWALVADEEKEEETVSYEQWKEYIDRYRKELANQPASSWAEQTLSAAVAAGITDGKRPHDLVTREEAAVMVVRGMG